MTDVSNGSDVRERVVTGYTGRISIVLAVGWLATRLGRQVLSPLLPTIIDSLRISPSLAGFALTLMMGLYGLFQYPGGRFSDQLSRTTVLAVGIGVMIVGFAALGLSGTYAHFLLGVCLVGVGGGLFFSPSRAFLSDLFVERRGQVFGLQTAAGMVGGMLAAGTAAVVAGALPWRIAFLAPILLLSGTLAFLHRWSHEGYVTDSVNLALGDTFDRVLATSRIRWLLLGYIFFGVTIQAFSGFLPTLLQVEKGLSPTLASVGFALIYGVGLFAGPVAGRASDVLARSHVVVTSLVLAGVGLCVLLLTRGTVTAFAGVIVTSLGLWSYVPSIQAYLMDTLPDDSLGGDFGMLKAIYTALGSLGPTYVGLVAERASYSLAFFGLVGCLFASALLVFRAMGME